jgi:hypothetical protein
VEQTFAWQAEIGCRVGVHLAGRLDIAQDGRAFSPDLVVRPLARCGDRTLTGAPQRVQYRDLARVQLLAQLQAAAEFGVPVDGRTCMLVPTFVLEDGRLAARALETRCPMETPPVVRTNVVPVPVQFTVQEPVFRDCHYVVTVYGVLAVTTAQAEGRAAQRRYEPDLRIQPGVSCGMGELVQAPERHLDVPDLTADEALDQVRQVATLVVERDGARCILEPDFALDGQELRMGAVHARCPLAQGGGPAPGR